MSIEATYHSEVRFVRSAHSSKTGTTITLALPDSDELSKVAGFDGKRYMLALVEIGDDEQPLQPPPAQATAPVPEIKGGALSVLAARWCQSVEFLEFIRPVYDAAMGGKGDGWGDVTPNEFIQLRGDKYDHYAAHCVKVLCECEQSRRELDHDQRKADFFLAKIRGPFVKYMMARGIKEPTPRKPAKRMEAEHA
jgi:hypothetical protein